MPFVVFHLNEPGRPPSRVAVAVERSAPRGVSVPNADRVALVVAGVDVLRGDRAAVRASVRRAAMTEPYGTIMEDLARIGLSSGADLQHP